MKSENGEKNLYANNFYGDDYKNRVKRWMVLMRAGEKEGESIEKNIKAKLRGGWRCGGGMEEKKLHETSQSESSNEQTEMKS